MLETGSDPVLLVRTRLVAARPGARFVRVAAHGIAAGDAWGAMMSSFFPYLPSTAGFFHWFEVPDIPDVVADLEPAAAAAALLVRALHAEPNAPLVAHRGLILRIPAELAEVTGHGSLARAA